MRHYPNGLTILALVASCLLSLGLVQPTPAEEAPSTAPTEQIQSRGGLRDPIGPYGATPEEKDPGSPEDIRSRGLTDKLKSKPLELKRQPQPGGAPPAHLCRTETKMLTQCKCSNQAECQQLTALFPNSCAAGSTHCEFIPMSRGPMPPLPPNLCSHQVPFTYTECSCRNAAECQQLTPFCPGSCPAGSQSCTCRPMQRR